MARAELYPDSMRWWLGLVLLGAAEPAFAQNVDQALAYDVAWTRGVGAEACPSGAVLKRAVRRYLGAPADVEAAWVFEASVSRIEGDKLSVELRSRDAAGALRGERRLEAADCGQLLEATALAMALAIDPERALRPRESTSTPTSMAAPTASAAPVTPPTSAPTPRVPVVADVARPAEREPRLRVGALVRGVVALNLLPKPTAAPELGFRVAQQRWSAQAVAGLYPRTIREGLDYSIGLTLFWLQGGYVWFERPEWLLRTDAGLGLGDLHTNHDAWYAAFRAGGSSEVRLTGGLRAEATLHAVMPWTHPGQPNEAQSEWRPALLGLLVGAGLVWEAPAAEAR